MMHNKDQTCAPVHPALLEYSISFFIHSTKNNNKLRFCGTQKAEHIIYCILSCAAIIIFPVNRVEVDLYIYVVVDKVWEMARWEKKMGVIYGS